MIHYDKNLILTQNIEYKVFLEVRCCFFDYINEKANENPLYNNSSKKLKDFKFYSLSNSFYFAKKDNEINKSNYLIYENFSQFKKMNSYYNEEFDMSKKSHKKSMSSDISINDTMKGIPKYKLVKTSMKNFHWNFKEK